MFTHRLKYGFNQWDMQQTVANEEKLSPRKSSLNWHLSSYYHGVSDPELCLNVAASKNKIAAAIMWNSRLRGGSPQTNVCHHCDWSQSMVQSNTSCHITSSTTYCITLLFWDRDPLWFHSREGRCFGWLYWTFEGLSKWVGHQERMYSVYPVSFEQEVLIGEKRAQDSGEEVVGSQVQRGGFHILSALQLWQQILRRRYHRQSVAYVSHSLLTYHNKLRSGRTRETWCSNVASEKAKFGQVKEQERKQCVRIIQASFQSATPNGDFTCANFFLHARNMSVHPQAGHTHTWTCVHTNTYSVDWDLTQNKLCRTEAKDICLLQQFSPHL